MRHDYETVLSSVIDAATSDLGFDEEDGIAVCKCLKRGAREGQ